MNNMNTVSSTKKQITTAATRLTNRRLGVALAYALFAIHGSSAANAHEADIGTQPSVNHEMTGWEEPAPPSTVIEEAKYGELVPILAPNPFPKNTFLAKSASFSWCASSATACAFSAGGFALACGADAAAVISAWFFPPVGAAVPVLTAGCLQTFAATGATCATAMGICVPGQGTYNPSPSRTLTQLHGADFGTDTQVTDAKCPGNHRVKKITIEQSGANGTAGSYLRRVQMLCTNGTVLTAGYDGPGGSGWQTTCGTGDLVHGLRVRSGSYVDAIGVNCRQVGWVDGTSLPIAHTSYVGALMGGTGGILRNANCASDEYIHGFKAEWYSSGAGAYLHHIKLHCK